MVIIGRSSWFLVGWLEKWAVCQNRFLIIKIGLETGIDDFVGFQGGNEHVEAPEENKDAGSDGLDRFGAAQLAAHGGVASQHQDDDGEQSLNTENCHGESQAERVESTRENVINWFWEVRLDIGVPANGDIEAIALRFVVDGSHGPCNTNTQEHVHSVWASYVTNRGISSLVFNGGDFAGKGVCEKKASLVVSENTGYTVFENSKQSLIFTVSQKKHCF